MWTWWVEEKKLLKSLRVVQCSRPSCETRYLVHCFGENLLQKIWKCYVSVFSARNLTVHCRCGYQFWKDITKLKMFLMYGRPRFQEKWEKKKSYFCQWTKFCYKHAIKLFSYSFSLKALDLVTMKKLDTKVNIIPIIAKADTITKTELSKFKTKVFIS